MNPDLATHISLLAAPILAAQIAPRLTAGDISTEKLAELRSHAITQAHALWLDTLERPGAS